VPNLTPALVEDLLRRHLDRRGFGDVEVARLWGEHPARGDVDSGVARAAIAAARAVAGSEPVVWPHMPATGPMHSVCAQFGVPAVGFGVGHAESGAHAPNESIRLDDYADGLRLTVKFLEVFASA